MAFSPTALPRLNHSLFCTCISSGCSLAAKMTYPERFQASGIPGIPICLAMCWKDKLTIKTVAETLMRIEFPVNIFFRNSHLEQGG